jgi:hypothetical protein
MKASSVPRIDCVAPLKFPSAYGSLYAGMVLRFATLKEMSAIVSFTRGFVQERLAPHAPVEIHRHMSGDVLSRLLAEVQSEYARSDAAAQLWSALFEAVGLDLDDTARDRLRLRFQVHSDPGNAVPRAVSMATVEFHRDTWGTNLAPQINWWAPVWPITAGRTFAIYPELWDQPVPNNSAEFDLAEVMERLRTAPETLSPGQLAPGPTQGVDPARGVPMLMDPGAVIVFSSAQAHAGIPNHTGLTRISLETRTVSIAALRARVGAPNVDGRSRWVAPGLFRRLSDGTGLHTLLGCERLVASDAW